VFILYNTDYVTKGLKQRQPTTSVVSGETTFAASSDLSNSIIVNVTVVVLSHDADVNYY